MQPFGTGYNAPVLSFSVRAGGQGWIKGQRWRRKRRDGLSKRAGQEQKEPARWRRKRRAGLSQGLGKARGRATPLRSTALPRPFPKPWGQAPFVLARPVGVPFYPALPTALILFHVERSYLRQPFHVEHLQM